jgi:hypothetical protein
MSAAGWALLGMVGMLVAGFLAGVVFATDPEAHPETGDLADRHHVHQQIVYPSGSTSREMTGWDEQPTSPRW